ncbi:MAG: VTT domain-containing protein [Gemmatimonadota bacterium]
MDDMKREPDLPPATGERPYLKLLALAALIMGGVALARFTPAGDYLTREGVGAGIETLRGSAWAPLVFVAVYAGAVALAIPGTILTLAGGALFGVFWGSVLNSIGANIGANFAFLIGRFLGRGGVARLLGSRIDRLDRATEDKGFQGLLTLRLIPVVPFNALNFGSGLTAISWPKYALATAIGILPGTVVYTFFADALLQGSQEASREAFLRVLLAGGLLILLSLLPSILRKMRISLFGVAAPVLVATLAGGAFAPADAQAIPDHAALTALLGEVVRGPRVDYALLAERRSALDRYVLALSRTGSEALAASPDPVRLAFWINAYNACMLMRVADNYPIRRGGAGLLGTLRNIAAGRPANSVWQIRDVFTGTFCPVAGEERSLDGIEHEIIRPTFGEPRIHFAVNCAARSCPPLAAEAYTPDALDAQLDAAVRGLLANEEHFRIERNGTAVVRLNRVLDWYGDDFGGEAGLRAFLAEYLEGEARAALLDPATRIEYFEYDWTLNDDAG